MITGVAICPPAPLLARELTGLDPVIPELRQACAAAAERLVRSGAEVIAVVGPGRRTAVLAARLAPQPRRVRPGARYPGRIDGTGSKPPAAAARARRPPARRGRVHRAATAAVGALRRAGRGLPAAGRGPARSQRPGRVAGHGGRERVPPPAGPRLPGPAGGGLRRGARGGGAQRRPRLAASHGPGPGARTARGQACGWQVLAGAMPNRAPSVEILYNADPFGVFYLVAWMAGQ